MSDKIKIIQDISLLFELSLSVGSSLDPRENCHRFLRTLISRKSLDFGAIWLHRAAADGEKVYELFFIHPHFREAQTSIPGNHYILQELASKHYFSISSSDRQFENVLHEKKVRKGSYAFIRLGDLGFLKLFSSNRPDGFSEMEMAQLKQVVDKLKISLDGCFAHLQLKAEIEKRQNAEQAIRESEEKYRGVLENMELGLLEVDLEDNIIRANNSFCQMLGYRPEEILGQKAIPMFLPESSQNFMLEREAERRMGRSSVYEIQLKRKNGDLIWGIISGAPIKNSQGQIVGSIGIQFDLTERKKLEHELAEAKISADRARMAERRFLTHMSHEIRTPINAVIGMTHLLSETHPDPTQKEYLSSLRFSADSLLGIIDNILDLSKIDAGEIEFEQKPFDLGYLLKSLLQTFQFKIKEKDIQIFESVDPAIENIVIGDPTRVNQILTNLLGNALKFTEKGIISLRLKLLLKSDGHYLIEFRVHDTGMGIPEDKLETIFEYFKQADVQINRKFGGTGLGLTIVKQLIEMQGGSIRVESQPGAGSDFIFTLRFGDSGIPVIDHEMLCEINPGEKLKKGLHFLIVEDNLLNQKLISKTIQTWECTFEVANNGLEALEKTAAQHFDVILMDVHMPELDGCETTLLIRKDVKNPNRKVPIIALTAAAMPEEKRRAFEAGMNGFLTKPISPKMLQEHIQRALHELRSTEVVQNDTETDNSGIPTPIGLQYLMDLSNNDIQFVETIIDAFLKETPVALQNLKIFAGQKNWDHVNKILHQLKPNFGLLGMKNLQELALAIESGARNNAVDWDKTAVMVGALITKTQAVLPLLVKRKKEMVLEKHAPKSGNDLPN